MSFINSSINSFFKVGMQRHFELGKYLRKRYFNLLGDGKYSADKVYIQSSDYDRTIMSAAANLAGLFPFEDNETILDTLRWKPIPIHTIPLKLDQFVGLERPCQRYAKAFNDSLKTPEYLASMSKVDRYIKAIKKNSGIKNPTFFDIYYVWDTLQVEYLENLT